MRLLIVTQALDLDDAVLSVYHGWVAELAKHFGTTEVVCLKEGRYNLPTNVHVHSLGKERGAVNRSAYAWRFFSLAWRLRHEYDVVFVHMNQEYILIAGWLWKLLGKRVYLWRNHYEGSLLTDMAASFCTKVFCTSKHSYTAKYAKTVLMPVGVDTVRFSPDTRVARAPHSILFLARMSPSKRPEMLVDALAQLAHGGQVFIASFVGSPLPKDEIYYEELKEKVRSLGLASCVSFYPGISNSQTPDLYRTHEIFVNTSPSGMLDKTIFEAAACGCLSLASSVDWAEQAGADFSFSDAATLSHRLATALSTPSVHTAHTVEENSLSRLGEALERVIR